MSKPTGPTGAGLPALNETGQSNPKTAGRNRRGDAHKEGDVTIDLTAITTTSDNSYELDATEGYDLVVTVNEGSALSNCCSGVEDIEDVCLECHLAVFA